MNETNNKNTPMTLNDILKANRQAEVKEEVKVSEMKQKVAEVTPAVVKVAEVPKDRTVVIPDNVEDVPAAAKKIVDILIPEKTVPMPDLNIGGGELYGEATEGLAMEMFKNSQSTQEVELNGALRAALYQHADTVLMTNKLREKKVENVVIPPTAESKLEPLNPEVKKSVNPIDNITVSPSTNKEIEIKNKRNKRAQLLKSRLGSNVEVYLPNSNIKVSITPNSSLLGKENFLNDATICLNSAGLLNMVRYTNTASRDVSLLIGSKDEALLKPGNNLKRHIHFSDFKYLILANALAAGEKSFPLNGTCTEGCNNKVQISIEQMISESLNESEKARFSEYRTDKSYEALTDFWRQTEIKPINFSSGIVDDIVDEDFGTYNEVIYELVFEEPTLEKFLNIKDLTFAIILNRFGHIIPDSIKNDTPDKLIEYLVEHHNERLTTLMQYCESIMVIKKVNVYYVYNEENQDRLTKYKDEYVPDVMELDDLNVMLDAVDDLVFKKAIQFLRDRFGLYIKYRNRMVEVYGEDVAKTLKDEDMNDLDVSTLLDYMTTFTVSGIKCDVCGKVHSSEVNSLALGFTLMREALRRR